MVVSSSPIAVTETLDLWPCISSKEFNDNKVTMVCGFTLKRVRDMIKTHRTDKYLQCSSINWPMWLND